MSPVAWAYLLVQVRIWLSDFQKPSRPSEITVICFDAPFLLCPIFSRNIGYDMYLCLQKSKCTTGFLRLFPLDHSTLHHPFERTSVCTSRNSCDDLGFWIADVGNDEVATINPSIKLIPHMIILTRYLFIYAKSWIEDLPGDGGKHNS